MSLLRVRDLRVVESRSGESKVGPLTFEIDAGECVALSGPSGAGKTLTVRALLNLLPPGFHTESAEFLAGGVDLRDATASRWNRVRGTLLGFVPQDAGSSLDPLRRVRSEVLEAQQVHRLPVEQRASIESLLSSAGFSDAATVEQSWPQELSGGMRQRVLLAAALAANPAVLLADEPTTGLDAPAQQRVVDALRDAKQGGRGMLLVSHDAALISSLADRVVEIAPAPHNRSVPRRISQPAQSSRPRVIVESITATYSDGVGIHDISCEVMEGRTLGILGESGAGKTTLARVLTGLLAPQSGTISVDGLRWQPATDADRRSERWRVQWVPQDALASFPRGSTVDQILREALVSGARIRRIPVPSRAELRDRVESLLRAVQLGPELSSLRPRMLSGGQRQRVAIARALAIEPTVLVCDEAVSALDASARDAVLQTLATLQNGRRISLIFISHDVRTVAEISDDVLVMQDGRIIEQGPAVSVLSQPQHPFTRSLITASGFTAPEP